MFAACCTTVAVGMSACCTDEHVWKPDKVWVAICPDCVQDGTRKCTGTHTHQNAPSWLPQREYLEIRLLLHHGSHSGKSLKDREIHTQQQQTAQRKHRSWNWTALCFWFLLLAVKSLDGTQTSRRVHVDHTGKSLDRGCCCTVAASKYAAFEGWFSSRNRFFFLLLGDFHGPGRL